MRRRGCKKPGQNITGQMTYTSSSPSLLDADGRPAQLNECPVGMVLRSAPWVYDAMGLHARCENVGPQWLTMPLFARQALSVIGAEQARQRELEQRQQDARRLSSTMRAAR